MAEIVIPVSKFGPVTSKGSKKQTVNQSFDRIGLIEMKLGNIVLRGRNGDRDRLYPFELAWQRFHSLYAVYCKMLPFGSDAVYEMKQILADYGSKLLEAVRYRETNGMMANKPSWLNNATISNLQAVITTLK